MWTHATYVNLHHHFIMAIFVLILWWFFNAVSEDLAFCLLIIVLWYSYNFLSKCHRCRRLYFLYTFSNNLIIKMQLVISFLSTYFCYCVLILWDTERKNILQDNDKKFRGTMKKTSITPWKFKLNINKK